MTKYEYIVEDIKQKIEKHIFKNNQVLPSENKMCSEYGVSRITVRRAMDSLIKENLAYRIQGKGCFVRDKADKKLSHIYSFTEVVAQQGKTPGKKQLLLEKYTPSEDELSAFGFNTPSLYKSECLYLADGKPYCLNTSYLPASLFPKLDAFNFNNQSLYEILKEVYHITVSRCRQHITAEKGNPHVFQLLGIDENQPLLHIAAKTYCLSNEEESLFEVYDAYILTEMMGYDIEKFG